MDLGQAQATRKLYLNLKGHPNETSSSLSTMEQLFLPDSGIQVTFSHPDHPFTAKEACSK